MEHKRVVEGIMLFTGPSLCQSLRPSVIIPQTFVYGGYIGITLSVLSHRIGPVASHVPYNIMCVDPRSRSNFVWMLGSNSWCGVCEFVHFGSLIGFKESAHGLHQNFEQKWISKWKLECVSFVILDEPVQTDRCWQPLINNFCFTSFDRPVITLCSPCILPNFLELHFNPQNVLISTTLSMMIYGGPWFLVNHLSLCADILSLFSEDRGEIFHRNYCDLMSSREKNK